MELGELRQLATQTSGLLERGLAHECITGVFGPELQLRYSMCGIATASLQKYLERRHGVITERHIKDVPALSNDTRTFSHVTLQHKDLMIDPTYSQFMVLGGLRVHDVMANRQFDILYPPEKIAVVPDDERASLASLLAKYLYVTRPAMAQLPKRDKLRAPDGFLRDASLASIDAVFQSIWDKALERPFRVAKHDGTDALSDRVVAHMEREEFGTIEV